MVSETACDPQAAAKENLSARGFTLIDKLTPIYSTFGHG